MDPAAFVGRADGLWTRRSRLLPDLASHSRPFRSRFTPRISGQKETVAIRRRTTRRVRAAARGRPARFGVKLAFGIAALRASQRARCSKLNGTRDDRTLTVPTRGASTNMPLRKAGHSTVTTVGTVMTFTYSTPGR